jgi:hypothetical protein
MWLWFINSKVKAIQHHTETLCKMVEHQNNLLAHALNMAAPPRPSAPPTQ